MKTLEDLKSLLSPAARRSIRRWLRRPPRLQEDWRILFPAGPVQEPHVVFDVGALRGKFMHVWRKWCPLAEFHAFEPSDEAMAELRARYGADSRFKLNQTGVGDSIGQLEYHVHPQSRSCNSFLPHDGKTWGQAGYHTDGVTRRIVPVTTLDAYCEQEKIDSVHLIKIDVQGFELKVLQGASEITLPRTKYLLIESGIRPLYVGAPRFSDVFNFMSDRGFHLIGLRSYHRGNHTLMEADMLFRRDDLMPPVDPNLPVDKIVSQIG